ncbi:MAG: peptidylprolyl isomerase [Rhodobacteraceae bacterium]|jgi:peptidyl-prolyl cis-trans isomerase C|nr:peptidylprolyl isomerase [Paracoccaceae bacterium]
MQPLLADIRVNGRVIPAAAIAAEAQNHPAPPGKPGLAWRAAARALALRMLMLDAAGARGLVPAPREVAPGQIETDDEALCRQLVECAVEPAPVEEAVLREIYARSPGRFRAPALYEAAHILIAAPPGERAAARAEAEAVLAEVLAAPRRFAEVAQQRSACESRASGGRLGQISAGDTVPEFEAVLRELAEGEIAPAPVESRFGFHIVRLDARAEGAVLPFEAVEPRLRAAAEKAAWVRAARTFADGLLAGARLEGMPGGAAV